MIEAILSRPILFAVIIYAAALSPFFLTMN
jgi:hypothetical protein